MSAAKAKMTAKVNDMGRSWVSAPPISVLIDDPFHGSNLNHSATRSPSTSRGLIVFAVAPRMTIGSEKMTLTAKAMPQLRAAPFVIPGGGYRLNAPGLDVHALSEHAPRLVFVLP